jgi:uncharacterized protein YdhG (YjbR/CyaY superfamily)
MTMTVDDYVKSKVLPEYRETVAMLRALVRECAPHAEERVSYDMPVFEASGKTFAWILPTKKGITFGFREGVQFEDKFDLLRGTGKHARHVKIQSAHGVEPDALRYFIKQALALDAP